MSNVYPYVSSRRGEAHRGASTFPDDPSGYQKSCPFYEVRKYVRRSGHFSSGHGPFSRKEVWTYLVHESLPWVGTSVCSSVECYMACFFDTHFAVLASPFTLLFILRRSLTSSGQPTMAKYPTMIYFYRTWWMPSLPWLVRYHLLSLLNQLMVLPRRYVFFIHSSLFVACCPVLTVCYPESKKNYSGHFD